MAGIAISEERRQRLEEFAAVLGIKFNDIGLLNQALTHTSYANDGHLKPRPEHNERLEFLGDAVLELAISNYLFERYPKLPEGELTKSRAATVCETSLARKARELGFGEYLLLGNGERNSGGADRSSTLEDAFEAVIGAVYLDQGWFKAQKYVLRHMQSELSRLENGHRTKDFKTMLQELVQRDGESHISYVMLRADGPDHDKEFEFAVKINGVVKGTGIGRSKKRAEQQAAKIALEALEKENK